MYTLKLLPTKIKGKYLQLHLQIVDKDNLDVYFKLTQSKLNKHTVKYSKALGFPNSKITVNDLKEYFDEEMILHSQDNRGYCLYYTGNVRLRDYAEPHLNIFTLKPIK